MGKQRFRKFTIQEYFLIERLQDVPEEDKERGRGEEVTDTEIAESEENSKTYSEVHCKIIEQGLL